MPYETASLKAMDRPTHWDDGIAWLTKSTNWSNQMKRKCPRHALACPQTLVCRFNRNLVSPPRPITEHTLRPSKKGRTRVFALTWTWTSAIFPPQLSFCCIRDMPYSAPNLNSRTGPRGGVNVGARMRDYRQLQVQKTKNMSGSRV